VRRGHHRGQLDSKAELDHDHSGETIAPAELTGDVVSRFEPITSLSGNVFVVEEGADDQPNTMATSSSTFNQICRTISTTRRSEQASLPARARSLDWKDGAHAARHRKHPRWNDSNAPATGRSFIPRSLGTNDAIWAPPPVLGTVTKTLPRTNSVPLWAAEVSISAGLIHD